MISRKQYKTLLKEKKNKKASIILGPRQAGKTTIVKALHKELGGVFVDVDVYSQYSEISTYEKLLGYLEVRGYKKDQKEFFYLFLDEFQRYPGLTMIMKNVYDHHDNIKIYATGSASLEIKEKVQESLAGRKSISYLYPFSFTEYLEVQGRLDLVDQLNNIKSLENSSFGNVISELKVFLEDFLIYGGYPEVAIEKDKKKRAVILRDIFDLYVKKDLVSYIEPLKIQNVITLVKKLAINNGAITNYSNYGTVSSLARQKVVEYLQLLEETFLIKKIPPFFVNKNKEVSRAPKVYFLDNGVRNFFVNNFNPMEIRQDAGELMESFYLSELIKNGEFPEDIKFYRNKNGVEVDFVLDRGTELIPIEIKYKQKLKQEDFSGIKKFMEEYKVKNGYLVNLNKVEKKIGVSKVSFNWLPEVS